VTVTFTFANVYCGCSRLDSLLDVFVCICSCFIQTVGRTMCFSSWVLRCKPDLGHLQFCL